MITLDKCAYDTLTHIMHSKLSASISLESIETMDEDALEKHVNLIVGVLDVNDISGTYLDDKTIDRITFINGTLRKSAVIEVIKEKPPALPFLLAAANAKFNASLSPIATPSTNRKRPATSTKNPLKRVSFAPSPTARRELERDYESLPPSP